MVFLDSEVDFLAIAFSNLTLHDPGPISRMTPDLLYLLFLLLAPSNPADGMLQTVLLSHVSREWRRIILDAPLMWTYVTMVVSKSKLDHSEVVQSYFQRSKRHPVTFHLSVLVDMEFRRCEVAKAISSCAHRFQAVHVLVDKLASLSSPLEVLSSYRMPLLQHFDLAVREVQRCTILMKAKTEITTPYLLSTESPTPYLDWSLKRYTLTTMLLKYLDLTPSILLPILIMTQHTLTHLELYNDEYDRDEDYYLALPCISLPSLISFSIGYRRPRTMVRFIRMLDLPNLQRLSVRDFGRCPENTTPRKMLDSCYPCAGKEMKDSFKLLSELCPFRSVIHLKLHGVICPTTSHDELLMPMQHLFSELKSLSIVLCDVDFIEALLETTSITPPERLERLSQLTVTSDEYSRVLQYLALRAARGLPPLKLLSVNPKMALLRHFYSEYAEAFHVLNRKRQNIPHDMCW
ncbi:hypothetical protein L208DRAFT_1389521 [Tricholoma matsutake]|nr:hypothetical protein L208DRAFT_1389521 [Tricholoma matsutake 945]